VSFPAGNDGKSVTTCFQLLVYLVSYTYASCFSAMMWGKLRQMFVTVTTIISFLVRQ